MFSSGGNAMRKPIVLSIILLLCCLYSVALFAANPLNIKFVQAIYEVDEEIRLKNPVGVACTDDYLVIADTGDNMLVKYPYKDKKIGAKEFEMPIPVPIVVQVNSKNEIYALNGRDRRIMIFNADGTEKEYLSPKGSPVSRNMVPRSFRIDGNDNIFILDISDEIVLVLDPAGNYTRHIPLPAQAGFFSDLAVNSNGTIFIVDSTQPAVYSAAPDAEQFTLLTDGVAEYTNFPTNIEVDASNTIYLVDKHGGSIVLLGSNGSFLGHKFGYGWLEGQFFYPAQLCISHGGNIFVADRSNSRVQMFQSEE